MKKTQRACSVAILACLCAACGSEKDAQSAPMAPTETVVGDQVRALEDAKAVEGTTMESKQAIDRALDQAEGQ